MSEQIQQLISVVVCAGLVFFFVKNWTKKSPAKVTVIRDEVIKMKFHLDKNDQLVMKADGIDSNITIPTATTEEISILLLPVARRVLRENGVQE